MGKEYTACTFLPYSAGSSHLVPRLLVNTCLHIAIMHVFGHGITGVQVSFCIDQHVAFRSGYHTVVRLEGKQFSEVKRHQPLAMDVIIYLQHPLFQSVAPGIRRTGVQAFSLLCEQRVCIHLQPLLLFFAEFIFQEIHHPEDLSQVLLIHIQAHGHADPFRPQQMHASDHCCKWILQSGCIALAFFVFFGHSVQSDLDLFDLPVFCCLLRKLFGKQTAITGHFCRIFDPGILQSCADAVDVVPCAQGFSSEPVDMDFFVICRLVFQNKPQCIFYRLSAHLMILHSLLETVEASGIAGSGGQDHVMGDTLRKFFLEHQDILKFQVGAALLFILRNQEMIRIQFSRNLFLQHRGRKESVVRKVVDVLRLQKQDLARQGMEQQILPFYVHDMHKAASADVLIFCRFLLRTQQHAGARVAWAQALCDIVIFTIVHIFALSIPILLLVLRQSVSV